ncbi:MAG: lipoprotein [Myroides sp.]|nr:lipoprotein [Myroides sp.]
MKKIITLLTAVLLLASCQPIMKTIAGVKTPKFTTTETAKKHLDKKSIQGKDVYFKSTKDIAIVMKNDVKIPNAVFFNNKGQQVEFRTNVKECTNDVTVFLNNIDEIDTLTVKEGMTLNQLVQHIVDRNGKPVTIDQNADAIVFINWSTYMGKLNKTVFEWTDIIQKIPNDSNVKVDYYLLSFDLLDHWEDKKLLEDKKK